MEDGIVYDLKFPVIGGLGQKDEEQGIKVNQATYGDGTDENVDT